MERGYRVNGETFCECIGDIFCRSSGARLGHVTTEAHADLLVPHPWHYFMSLDVVERENHDWGWNRDFDKWRVPWWRKRPQLGWRGSQGVHKDIPTWPLEGSKRSTPSEREGKGVESFFFHPRTRLVQLGKSRPDL